jgi:hypothetical protein
MVSSADGVVIGGMSYAVDPQLTAPPAEQKTKPVEPVRKRLFRKPKLFSVLSESAFHQS